MQSKNRNEIYEKLLLLSQYVRKYGDKSPAELKLPDFLSILLEKSKKLKTVVPNILGYGYEHRHVAEECIEILNIIKYQYPEQAFNLLVQLSKDSNKDIQKKALDIIKSMSKYDSVVLKNVGFSVQLFILDQLKKWNTSIQKQRLSVIKTIFGELFELEYENSSMEDYKTYSSGFGLLRAGEQIKQIREQAIHILLELFKRTKKVSAKIMILETLNEATRTPNRGNYSDEIETLVKDNTTVLIKWYIALLKKENSFEVIKEIDEQSNWFKRRFNTVDGLTTLQAIINSNEKYTIYRDLVGYDNEYSEDLDWRKARETRNEKIKQNIENINELNKEYWLEIIVRISSGFSLANQGRYVYFNQFLYTISVTNPDFAKELLSNHENKLNNILYHIIAGLWESDYEYARNKIINWAMNGVHLLDCVLIFLYLESVEIEILDQICTKAIELKDTRVLTEIVRIIIYKFDKSQSKELFIKTIKILSIENNSFFWTVYMYFDEKSILSSFTENDYDQILEAIINCPQIDYHMEQLLIPIASESPGKLIQFLEKRIEIQNNNKKTSLNKNYDAIPYHFSTIGEILNNKSDECLPLIFLWFKKKNGRYYWEASELLHKMFPSFGGTLESFFLQILPNKDLEDAQIILQVLRKYDGHPSIYEFCKQFVIEYFNQPELLKELIHVLSETGVVSGEYGFVETYKNKKSDIKKWNKTKNEHIRKFVKQYTDYLNACITAETKRSDEQVELMKLEFEVRNK